MARRCKRRGRGARAHHTGMPRATYAYALAIQPMRVLSPLLGVGLELLLERSELGEGRIGIGCLVALAAFAASLEILGPQSRITLGPLAVTVLPFRVGHAVRKLFP